MIYTSGKLYEMCLDLAKRSPCQKLGFGALLINEEGRIVTSAYNGTIDPLADMCQPECCRFKIPSRTQSMLGVCGHAEESCLWQAIRDDMRRDLSGCELYVQGVSKNGDPTNKTDHPLTKTDKLFTCIRCATQMYLSGVRGVNVWFENEWNFVPSEEALAQAKLYATEAIEVDSK